MKVLVTGTVLTKFTVNNKECALLQQGNDQPITVKNVNGNATPGEQVDLLCKASITSGYGKPPAIDLYCVE